MAVSKVLWFSVVLAATGVNRHAKMPLSVEVCSDALSMNLNNRARMLGVNEIEKIQRDHFREGSSIGDRPRFGYLSGDGLEGVPLRRDGVRL